MELRIDAHVEVLVDEVGECRRVRRGEGDVERRPVVDDPEGEIASRRRLHLARDLDGVDPAAVEMNLRHRRDQSSQAVCGRRFGMPSLMG